MEAEKAVRAIGDRAEVLLFDHGSTMLERLARDGAPDVLLLDWQLPDITGIEICKFVRATFDQAALPIVMLTVFADKADVAMALSAGANDYLTKPFNPTELAARVESALRTRSLFEKARRAEAALQAEHSRLQASETRFQTLARAGIIGIVELDRGGLVLEANDAFAAMLGFSRADIAGGRVRMRDLTSSASLDADEVAARELLERGAFSPYEKELIRRDGQVVTVLQGGALLDGTSGRCITYFLDVSAHRSVEADRARLYEAERAARAEAEAASRMKDDFLATVSHELRTPLNVMLGWASIARAQEPTDPEIARALETIERNARAQAKLIDDILDVSRIVTGKVALEFTAVDFREVVRDVVDGLRPTVSTKGITLVCETPAAPCDVVGDLGRLQQIAWNLLTNAVKFTPAGGVVTAYLEATDAAFVLAVTDTGIGLSPGFLPYVFDRFRQADASSTRRHGGLGLGLSIVRNLAELHGGRVSAESAGLGQGATFRVEIPRGPRALTRVPPPDVEAPMSVAPQAAQNALAGITVLVVDDEDDSRDVTAALLERRGAEVLQADGMETALDVLAASHPDVLVSDIGMPAADGYTLIRAVRAATGAFAQTPAIALTAYARDEDAKRATQAGFERHLSKPVDVNQLVRVILELTQSR